MKKSLLLFILTIWFFSCGNDFLFERSFYENTSHIKFPEPFTILTTYDNAQTCTISILDLSKTNCDQFARENNFVKPGIENPEQLLALYLLDSNYRTIPAPERMLINAQAKVPGKKGWTYLLDTVDCRLYCEIDYPDWGGN